jgi:hypothetical protein
MRSHPARDGPNEEGRPAQAAPFESNSARKIAHKPVPVNDPDTDADELTAAELFRLWAQLEAPSRRLSFAWAVVYGCSLSMPDHWARSGWAATSDFRKRALEAGPAACSRWIEMTGSKSRMAPHE